MVQAREIKDGLFLISGESTDRLETQVKALANSILHNMGPSGEPWGLSCSLGLFWMQFIRDIYYVIRFKADI